jgi:hypothetical protein
MIGMSHDDLETARVIMNVMSTLSSCGAVSIILSFWAFKELRDKVIRKLVVLLSLCDLMMSLAYLMPNHTEALCQIQATNGIYWATASFILTDAIGLVIYLTVVHWGSQYNLPRLTSFFVAAAFLVPGITTALCFGLGATGRDDGFGSKACWIRQGAPKGFYVLGGKGVEWSSLLVVSFFYISSTISIVHLNRGNKQMGYNTTGDYSRLIFVPLIFIVFRLPSGVRSVYNIAHGTESLPVLAYFQAIGDPGQGFGNGLCYALFDVQVRKLYARLLPNVCWRCYCCNWKRLFRHNMSAPINTTEKSTVVTYDEAAYRFGKFKPKGHVQDTYERLDDDLDSVASVGSRGDSPSNHWDSPLLDTP